MQRPKRYAPFALDSRAVSAAGSALGPTGAAGTLPPFAASAPAGSSTSVNAAISRQKTDHPGVLSSGR